MGYTKLNPLVGQITSTALFAREVWGLNGKVFDDNATAHVVFNLTVKLACQRHVPKALIDKLLKVRVYKEQAWITLDILGACEKMSQAYPESTAQYLKYIYDTNVKQERPHWCHLATAYRIILETKLDKSLLAQSYFEFVRRAIRELESGCYSDGAVGWSENKKRKAADFILKTIQLFGEYPEDPIVMWCRQTLSPDSSDMALAA